MIEKGNRMIERFLSTYKDGFEVYLNPSEKDQIIEEIERLNKRIDKAIEYINKEFVFSDGTLGEADVKLLDILKGSDR